MKTSENHSFVYHKSFIKEDERQNQLSQISKERKMMTNLSITNILNIYIFVYVNISGYIERTRQRKILVINSKCISMKTMCIYQENQQKILGPVTKDILNDTL